jgi:phosphatidate phosphatase PAH1
MCKLLKIVVLSFLILFVNSNLHAQTQKLSLDDLLLQDSIYKSNKKKVLNFSIKEFDALFFEYFKRKNDPDIILSKTEFYSYTVQIATFSDRLAVLYPEQKEAAEQSKQQWLAESYEEYLQSKGSQKK